MIRLGNSNGGLSPNAMRSLHIGGIRPTFTWGVELWNGPHTDTNISGMERIECQALKNITAGYHGSSKQKLGFIAAVEPLHIKFDDLSASWAARSPRTGDPTTRKLADAPPSPGCTSWHDATVHLLPYLLRVLPLRHPHSGVKVLGRS